MQPQRATAPRPQAAVSKWDMIEAVEYNINVLELTDLREMPFLQRQLEILRTLSLKLRMETNPNAHG